jgi:hypothetical protein
MRPVSRGYLTISDSFVRHDPWSITLGDSGTSSSADYLEDWSYYQSVTARLTVVAEVDELYSSLALDDIAEMSLVILWVSPGTSLRGASQPVRLEHNETSVELEVEGGVLRGEVRFEAQIVLTRPSATPKSLLAPAVVGAVLWQSSHTVKLEGSGSRMPVLALPFSEQLSSAGSHAMWWLQVAQAPDFNASADSVLWMWLNSENDSIATMLADPDSDSAKTTQRFLKVDLYRQLVEIGLRSTDFDLDEKYPTGSLGAVVAAPLRLLGSDIAQLRGQFEQDTPTLEVMIQARLGGL